jgi:hypothetical protein
VSCICFRIFRISHCCFVIPMIPTHVPGSLCNEFPSTRVLLQTPVRDRLATLILVLASVCVTQTNAAFRYPRVHILSNNICLLREPRSETVTTNETDVLMGAPLELQGQSERDSTHDQRTRSASNSRRDPRTPLYHLFVTFSCHLSLPLLCYKSVKAI